MESDTYDITATMPQDAATIDGDDRKAIANEENDAGNNRLEDILTEKQAVVDRSSSGGCTYRKQ